MDKKEKEKHILEQTRTLMIDLRSQFMNQIEIRKKLLNDDGQKFKDMVSQVEQMMLAKKMKKDYDNANNNLSKTIKEKQEELMKLQEKFNTIED